MNKIKITDKKYISDNKLQLDFKLTNYGYVYFLLKGIISRFK